MPLNEEDTHLGDTSFPSSRRRAGTTNRTTSTSRLPSRMAGSLSRGVVACTDRVSGPIISSATIELPVPACERQLWFDCLQAKVREMLDAQADAETEFDATMPSILDRAFKGEL